MEAAMETGGSLCKGAISFAATASKGKFLEQCESCSLTSQAHLGVATCHYMTGRLLIHLTYCAKHFTWVISLLRKFFLIVELMVGCRIWKSWSSNVENTLVLFTVLYRWGIRSRGIAFSNHSINTYQEPYWVLRGQTLPWVNESDPVTAFMEFTFWWGKQSIRKTIWFIQCHTSSWWQSWDLLILLWHPVPFSEHSDHTNHAQLVLSSWTWSTEQRSSKEYIALRK